jgi:serine/threonine-protein kinase RsbW
VNHDQLPGTVESSFPGTKASVSLARAWLSSWLEQFCVKEGPAANAVLVLSELATNAATHSRSSDPHGSYLVRLRRGVKTLRVEVVDAGGRTEPRARRGHQSDSRQPSNGSRPPVADTVAEEGGHGLALVEAFTTRWWTRGTEQGRTVGAEIALDGTA